MDLTVAAADKVWHVEIDDQDVGAAAGSLHDFTISSGSDELFRSGTFSHGVETFDIAALPAGLYPFKCTFHPAAMRGTIEIR
jgi:plastocyanin